MTSNYSDALEVLNKLSKGNPNILSAFNNPNRIRIMKILEGAKQPLNIREISQKLNLSYPSTHKHIQKLAGAGLVKLKKDDNATGQAVSVEIV